VRRSADLGLSPPQVLDGEGRSAPFDGRRLQASIRRALVALGPDAADEAEGLAGAVGVFVRRRAAGPALSSDVLAGLVLQVLEGAGHGEAARLYARSRRREETAVASRVRQWLERESSLSAHVVQQVALEVEAGVSAAGLADPPQGLLREWVDHALRHRGMPEALGLTPSVALSGRELSSLLASGPPGLAAEQRAASALLARYTLHSVLPSDVGLAHADGRLDFGELSSHGRAHALCLPLFQQPEVKAARAACRVAVAGALLRELGGLVSHEVVVLWDGPAPRGDDRLQLELQLRRPVSGSARIVLCLPATDPARVAPWLHWDALGGLFKLRLHGPGFHPDLLQQAALRPGALEVTRQAPGPGIVLGAVAVNLLRPALDGVQRDTGTYLDAVEAAASLAAAGLLAWRTEGAGHAALEHLHDRLGATTPLAVSWALQAAGLIQARITLLGAGARARQNGHDLAVAIGDRLRRGWERRGAPVEGASTGPGTAAATLLRLQPATQRTQTRFRRLDLPLRAPVVSGAAAGSAGEVEPLGEGESFSHDGEIDPAASGREVAALRRCLGIAGEAPAPRKAGPPDVREAFLRAFLEPTPDDPEPVPCA